MACEEADGKKKGEKKLDRSKGESEKKSEGKREKERQKKHDAGSLASCTGPGGTAQPVAPTWAGLWWRELGLRAVGHRAETPGARARLGGQPSPPALRRSSGP